MAIEISKNLNFNETESNYFINLVDSKFSRSRATRIHADNLLNEIRIRYLSIDSDSFSIISDWYHLAILSLIQLEDFKNDVVWISNRLGISEHQTKSAIARLIRLNMVKKGPTGNLISNGNFFANPDGTPSASIRSFHSQILKKAIAALETQLIDEREYLTLTLNLADSELSETKAMLQQFMKDFSERFRNSNQKKDQVYALGLQLFRLTTKEPKQLERITK